jgi:hypothetical protein
MEAAYFVVLVVAMVALAAGCLLIARRMLAGGR